MKLCCWEYVDYQIDEISVVVFAVLIFNFSLIIFKDSYFVFTNTLQFLSVCCLQEKSMYLKFQKNNSDI